jgi:hypothetical protein
MHPGHARPAAVGGWLARTQAMVPRTPAGHRPGNRMASVTWSQLAGACLLAVAPVRWHMMAVASQAAGEEKVGSIMKGSGREGEKAKLWRSGDHWDGSEMMK